jgi:membrane-bound lytic murein transglycosylase D
VREKANPVEEELKSLMAEFGAETFRFPPEFLEQVERFVDQYQGPERARITSALGGARKDLETMRAIFQRQQLPPDLAYMAIVESAVTNVSNRKTGAAGPWQFTAPTARAFGLVVNEKVDERLDVRKSTLAACKLMRELILDFGAEGSVMLAVAAYNVGSGKVRQAVRTVKDPIKQRNFWYLYRIGALPLETREYVPKVLAVLIIARNPGRFGF